LQYNIKKKEEVAAEQQQDAVPDNPLMRKKKTPEELAREAEAEDEDELTSKFAILRLPACPINKSIHIYVQYYYLLVRIH